MFKRYLRPMIVSVIFLFTLFIHPVKAQLEVFQAAIDDDGIQRVDILGGEYYFRPDHIVVKVNVPVEFSVRKRKRLIPHNIVMYAPAAEIEFKRSFGIKPLTIRFTPRKTGEFQFYCDKRLLFFKSHREKGMEGILEVIE
jgi:plastocyanin